MKAAIISIGDELLIGQTVNTNASFIGEELTNIGVDVQIVLTISDQEKDILETLSFCQNKYDLVLITGGLGPTKDDITKTTLAKYLAVPLVQDDAVLANVMQFFKAFEKEIQPVNKLQALVPEGSRVLMNKVGTAPGMWMQKEKSIFISMPGVPREMKYLVREELVPVLKEEFSLPTIYSWYILTQGIGESYIAERIASIEDALPAHIKLAYLPSRGVVKLRLTGRGIDEVELKQEVNNFALKIESELNDVQYGRGDESLAKIVGKLLLENNNTVSVAESLSGGAIAKELTSVSGASRYFIGGMVAYDSQVKINELQVSAKDIAKHSVVSREVAIQMALGAKQKFKTDYAIATTGFAGPTGGTKSNPVGTVYIAIASPAKVIVERFNMGMDRQGVVRRTVLTALNKLREKLSK